MKFLMIGPYNQQISSIDCFKESQTSEWATPASTKSSNTLGCAVFPFKKSTPGQ